MSSVNPPHNGVLITHIHAYHGVVGTRIGAGWSGALPCAKVAFGCLFDRLLSFAFPQEFAGGIADRNDLNIVIRTGIGAGGTSDTGEIIDHNLAVLRHAVNGSRWAADHADWVLAVHTGIGHHRVVDDGAVTNESGVSCMTRSTCLDTIVASSASVHVDQHRGGAVDKTVFDHELEEIRIHRRLRWIEFRSRAGSPMVRD